MLAADRATAGHGTRFRPLLWLALLGLIAILVSLALGSVSLTPREMLATLIGEGSSLHHTLVWELRLPRALAAFGTGALLALAGALMQVLLRNPLADPYVLGLSGGASVAALLAMLAGVGTALVSASAFVGALVSTLIVFALAHGSGSWTPARLLLTGIVMASGWGAIITFLLAVSPVEQLPGMLYWLMGDMAYAGSPWPVLCVALLSMVVLVPLGRTLNVLARGGLQAAALGVAVRPLEWTLYLAASLATAMAVTTAGSVGFVGLMVPHMLRLRLGADQRLILPASLLAGGALLTLADTLARSLIAPQQLPVGVITALIGVPSFLYLLHRSRG